MSDIVIGFGADIKDLQKGVKKAVLEIEGFEDAAKGTTSATKKFGDATTVAARNTNKAAEAAKKARDIVNSFRRSTAQATDELGKVKSGAANAVVGLGNLGKQAGLATGSIGKLAAGFLGAGGIIALADFATDALISLGAAAVESFQKAEREAEKARQAFKSVISESLSIEASFDEISFGNRSGILEAIAQTEKEIATLEESSKRQVQIRRTPLGATAITPESEDRRRARSAADELLKKERGILEELQNQLKTYDRIFEARQRALGLGAGSSVQLDNSDISIDGGDELVAPIDRAVLEDLKLFEQRRLDLIKANQELANTFDQVTAAIERENNALFAQREAQEAKSLQDEIAINNANRLANASRNASIQAENVGQLIAIELGQEAAAGLADVVLGFEDLKSVLGGIKESLRGIVREIAAAAAKAALLSIFFPGASQAAGGFKGLFKGALGLTPFAKGGIVTGPTPALVGEAGPEAIIPLDRLPSMGMSNNLTVEGRLVGAGEDLLVSLRSVNTGRNGRGGRINI